MFFSNKMYPKIWIFKTQSRQCGHYQYKTLSRLSPHPFKKKDVKILTLWSLSGRNKLSRNTGKNLDERAVISTHLRRVKTSARRVGAKKHPLFLRVPYLYAPTPRPFPPHHLPGVGIRGYGEAKKFRDDGKQIVEKKNCIRWFFFLPNFAIFSL